MEAGVNILFKFDWEKLLLEFSTHLHSFVIITYHKQHAKHIRDVLSEIKLFVSLDGYC